MIYTCFRCDTHKSFKNDDDAEKNGWAMVGYNMAENERYANCPTCLEFINQNRKQLLEKHTQKKIIKINLPMVIIPPRDLPKPKKKSKNEKMFEDCD